MGPAKGPPGITEKCSEFYVFRRDRRDPGAQNATVCSEHPRGGRRASTGPALRVPHADESTKGKLECVIGKRGRPRDQIPSGASSLGFDRDILCVFCRRSTRVVWMSLLDVQNLETPRPLFVGNCMKGAEPSLSQSLCGRVVWPVFLNGQPALGSQRAFVVHRGGFFVHRKT